jgi:nucleoside-diphosphate-sugar epimerase
MLLALGLGYSAYAFAQHWRARGEKIAGTFRDAARDTAQPHDSDGISRLHFAANTPLDAVERALGEARHVLVSIPPDDASALAGDIVLARLASQIAAAHHIVWLGYLSTTGVYGDRGGAWVDETSERRPGNRRSERRAAAEDAWLALWRDRGVPVHIFRLSGIYGPGRSAIDQLRAGTAKRIDKPGQIFSRVHVEDIANVLAASIARPRSGAIYNVADDAPAPASDVVAHAAALLGVPAPPLEPFDAERLPPMAREFYAETRRIRNERIKRELGVVLRYPDYKKGLAAILEESQA